MTNQHVVTNTQSLTRSPQHAAKEGFAHVVTYTGLRGRWETISTSPLTICDTGHNSHGIATYVKQLKEIRNQKSEIRNCALRIVFGMVADKDIDAVLRLLPADAVYYFTQPASHRALPAADLLARWRALHSLTNTRSLTRSHQHAI